MKNTFLDEHETRKELSNFVLRANRLSMDEECFNFEREFAQYQGRNDCILFNSGGSANLALLQACKNLGILSHGDQVGFSALTWSTNTMPIIQMGFEPVPIDCKIETLNVMAENLERTLKNKSLKALFITNVLGLTGDLSAIRDLCNKKNIILLEDNCESLGTELAENKAGNFSLGSTFSYFVAHHMSTIEGGSICTDNLELAKMLRMVRANGWDRNLSAIQQNEIRKKYEIKNEFQAKYTFYDLAFNFRPTEITGFLGRLQLKKLPESLVIREKNFSQFQDIIKSNPDLIALSRDHIQFLSSFAIPILCKTPELRDKYFYQFSGAGIEIRPMIAGNIQKQPFFKKYVSESYDLPSTDFIHQCGFYCGNYPELSRTDLDVIKSCLYGNN